MRKNGFAKPFSVDQVTSWVIQPVIVGSFVTFVAALLNRDKCLGILIPYGVLVLLGLLSWLLCEIRDSSEPRPPSSFSCLRLPFKETRYCTICCKTSPGLDHHCSWLNTCIGERNYEAFYCLTITSSLQTVLQTVIGVLMCTLWLDEIKKNSPDDWHTPLTVLLWIHNACSFSLGNSYILLAGFHTYLLLMGTGTYDFILENGSEGLCARMLKCNCLRRHKRKKQPKRSHVRAAEGDENDGTGVGSTSKTTSKLSRRGSPTAAAKAALQASSGTQVSATPVGTMAGKLTAPRAGGVESSKSDKVSSVKKSSTVPNEQVEDSSVPAATDRLHVEVNLQESEGIFQAAEKKTASSFSPTSSPRGPRADL